MSTIIWYFSICLHLVWWSLGPSVFLQMALFYSYLWLSNIPLCVCVCMFLCVRACMFSHVWLFVTLWNVALQASLSKEFSRQEYLSGLPFPPSRGDFVCVCVCVCVCVLPFPLSKGVCVHVCYISLSIPLSIDIFVASVSWPLWMVLQLTLGYMYLFKVWFSPDTHMGVGLLDRMVVVFLVFKWTFILFSIVAVPVDIPTNTSRGFPFLHILFSIYCL